MPDFVGVLRQHDPPEFAPSARVEQAQLDLFRVGGEEREVHAGAVPRGAERERAARPDGGARAQAGLSTTVPSGGSVSWTERAWPVAATA